MNVIELLFEATNRESVISAYNVETNQEKKDTIENIENEFGYFEVIGIEFGENPICINVEYIE